VRLIVGIMLFATAVIASADDVIPKTGEYAGVGQDYNLGHDRDDKHNSTGHGHSDKHDDEPDSKDHNHSDKHKDKPVNSGHAHDEDMWIMRPELAETTITVTDSGDLLIAGRSPALSWAGDKWVGHDDSSHVEVTFQVFPTMNLFELLVFEDDSPVSGTRYYMVKTR